MTEIIPSSKNSSIWKLILKYPFEKELGPADNDLLCTICKKLMVDACQSACGCQFCYKCIKTFLKQQSKFCPGIKDECKEQHIVMDRDVLRNRCMNNRISKLKVRCPDQKCQTQIFLCEMEEHLRLCAEKQLHCPYTTMGCDDDGSDMEVIVAHLHGEAFTHSRLLINWVYNLKNEMNELKDEVEASRSEISSHKEEPKLSDMQSREVIEYMKVKITEIIDRVESQGAEIQYLIEESKKKEDMILTLVKNSRDMEAKIAALDGESAKQRREPQKFERASSISSMVNISHVKDVAGYTKINVGLNKISVDDAGVDACFKVDKFGARKANKETFRSPCFYSHVNGYKLRLRVDPAGYTLGTHMSVYFVICKGEYDDVLPWPCRHTFAIGITNQRDGTFYSNIRFDYALTEESNRYLFDKPIHKDNKGCGNCKFISHAELESVADLIVGDSVVVRCVVNAPS